MSPKMSLLAAAILVVVTYVSAFAGGDEWQKVADALGKAGTETTNGVYRVGFPRTDLKVLLDGVELKPALALGSWLGFQPEQGQALVMGDLVLTAEEVSPVMQKLADEGIEITALHNHLLRAVPATFYLHVRALGGPVKLATALHGALILTQTPFAAPAVPSPDLEFDTGMIDTTLGAKGKANGGVYQVSLRRAEPVSSDGMGVPDNMGSAELINFQATGDGKVAISGDFALTEKEVNPVLRVLRKSGIEVTALHNHMLDEEPRLFFLHFWANDALTKLVPGLKAALDLINLERS